MERLLVLLLMRLNIVSLGESDERVLLVSVPQAPKILGKQKRTPFGNNIREAAYCVNWQDKQASSERHEAIWNNELVSSIL
jgi:hypothetical protein